MRQKRIPNKEAKDGATEKLKTQIRNLQKEVKRLKSELKAYDQAFKKTKDFLHENTKEISLDDLIIGAKEDKSLKKIKDDYSTNCTKCANGIVTKKILPFGEMYLCNVCGDRRVVKTQIEDTEELDC
jgi:molecular chaperone GrpE (heat shock protein)